MQYNFFSLLKYPPNSEKEVFANIKRYISVVFPERLRCLKPASKTHIQQLEEEVELQFGQPLPPSYKMYLQQMGTEDGGLLSSSLDYGLDEWEGFKRGDMAQGAYEFIRDFQNAQKSLKYFQIPTLIKNQSFEIPPFWYFYYGWLAELGWGFSPITKEPDQLIRTDAKDLYLTHDTFSKLLFFCTYVRGLDWLDEHGKILEYDKPLSGSHGTFLVTFLANCPQEWALPGHALLVDFLKKLESEFAFEECWFSGNKEFDLFDTDDNVTGVVYKFSRYVAFHTTSDLIIHVRYNSKPKSIIRLDIIGQNMCFIKQIVSTILQQVDLQKISLKKLTMNE